ncbi:hypothetical protein AB4Z10_19620 [Bosea sp. RAF48]|uniref:hypothetical protein n=1 Tax=Bosea sp. RAF48 TaxID=3237480 RepID=UPI003F8F1947
MINIGPRGSRLTMGLPGTGISYTRNLSSPRPVRRASTPAEVYLEPPVPPEPMHPDQSRSQGPWSGRSRAPRWRA